ncbi:InlB B-repeat-containing protein [Caminicella sporogenes]|uniref:InlB B-repeat-containing protein n=1 Tax=Caminicella sporogenes TaxID=166485 RepID=UPI0025423999|nr:InlB B-repeat-containing protein [Caminicella sporogenes]WIF95203.1 InlB B-repeat-containing protein [Caminicella sporogenes]
MNLKKIRFIYWILSLSMIINLFITNPLVVYAEDTIDSITVVSDIIYSSAGKSQVIDPNLSIVGTGNIYSATVNIDNGFSKESGDMLSWDISKALGLSVEYNSESGVLTISGKAPVNTYQELLRTIKFQTNAISGTRSIVFLVNNSNGKMLYYEGTGHYYEFVNSPGISWTDAKTSAEVRYYDGHQGYLATITSQEENDFITSKCDGSGWLGASDAESEGVWKWVTGPEAGTQFWNGNELGSPVGGRFNKWKAGLEPNDWGTGEDYLHIMGKNRPGWAYYYEPGDWNDYPLSVGDIQGYVVEYGDTYINLSASSKSAITNVTIDNQYTVNFEENGGSEVSDQIVNYNEKAIEPSVPRRIGYAFGGWYIDEELTTPYDFNTPVTNNITLYAKWISNGESYVVAEPDIIKTGSYLEKEFILTLENDSIKQKITNKDLSLGGVFSNLSIEILGNTDITVTTSVYAGVYKGFNQKGIGEIIINPEVLDKSEIPLVANITVKGEYTVKFLDDKGNILKEEDVVRGTSATAPIVPEKEGYKFIGWDKEFNNVTSNLIVTAQYEIKKYTIKYNSNGGSEVLNQMINYNEKATEPEAPTRIGYTFEGWYADEELTTPYDFNIPVTNDITLYAKWIKKSKTKSKGGENNKGKTGVEVIVNGQKQTAGKEVVKKENNIKEVEIFVETRPVIQKIEEVLKAKQEAYEKDKKSIQNIVQISVGEKEAKRVTAKLTGELLRQMEANKFKLSVNTGEIEYIIPAEEINIKNAAKILGVDKEEIEEIEIEIKIDKLEETTIKRIKQEAEQKKYKVILLPVDFQVVAKTKGRDKEVTITKFNEYVERIIAIPEGIDPNKITTGVVYNLDGSFSHIPTEVFIEDNRYYAKLNSLTNSTYIVIWNPLTVSSVEKHWAKEYVNDMASRLIIKNPENFNPDKPITRGDFAEYITKALGIYRTGVAKKQQFTDVSVTDEIADAITIAVEYDIIRGYPDKTFRPKALISREEAMAMFARAMDIVKLKEKDSNRIENYKDISQVSSWVYDEVKKTLGSCVFNGRSRDTIEPHGIFTYAEAATAVRNLLIEADLINK